MNINNIYDIIKVAKRLDEKGLVNAFEGNISVLEGDYMYITPSGQNKAWLTPDMIAVFNEKTGKQISGIKASSEIKMHRAVYRLRNDVHGIVHAHAPFLTSYAIRNTPFFSKGYAELIWDHKVIEVAAYGRPGSDEIHKHLGPIFSKKRNAALLANHGVITIGDTVFKAMNRMESIENAAKIVFIAKMMGEESSLPQEEIDALLML